MRSPRDGGRAAGVGAAFMGGEAFWPASRNGFVRLAFSARRGQRQPRRRGPDPRRFGAGGVGRADALLQPRQRLADARLIRVGVEGQPRPAKMFEVFAVVGLSPQELRRRRDARVGRPALQRQKHHGRGRGNRLQRDSENAAIAVVDSALVQGAVEQQFLAFADARVIALADATQGQTRPGGRFHP